MTDPSPAARLMQVLEIEDAALCERLAAHGIGAETALLVRLAPFVQIAWADGRVADTEKERIRDIARRAGLTPESAAWPGLEAWFAVRPTEDLFAACAEALRQAWSRRPPEEAEALRRETLWTCERIAWAAGGFFDLGTRVSENEAKEMARLAERLGGKPGR